MMSIQSLSVREAGSPLFCGVALPAIPGRSRMTAAAGSHDVVKRSTQQQSAMLCCEPDQGTSDTTGCNGNFLEREPIWLGRSVPASACSQPPQVSPAAPITALGISAGAAKSGNALIQPSLFRGIDMHDRGQPIYGEAVIGKRPKNAIHDPESSN